MTSGNHTFTVASDAILIELIMAAQDRLALVAPALSKPVAEALIQRFNDLDQITLIVVLDADPEVYRMGYGEPEALELIRTASAQNLVDLREQPGIRIGIVVSDTTTLVFSPVSRNIEAGSIVQTKPNAILLSGRVMEPIAEAVGVAEGQAEIGQHHLEPQRVEDMQRSLAANPPRPFDLTRRLNVFTSQVQYVELKVSNYKLSRRRTKLPDELVDVGDSELKESITSRIRIPFDFTTPVKVTFQTTDREEELEVTERYIENERKRIEDDLTYLMPHFGRIILRQDRSKFDLLTSRLRNLVEAYHAALRTRVEDARSDFIQRLSAEFAPRWKANPPRRFERWSIEVTDESIDEEIGALADRVFRDAVEFEPPQFRVIYKDIAFENICDPKFVGGLKAIMERKNVPSHIRDALFETAAAAPEKTFKGRGF